MLGLALKGLAQVSAGDIAGGMRCLDESTTAAVSGEMTDPDCCATACCYLIYACELVRDYDRAAQWCAYMKELATRWKYSLMLSLCRTHYAGVLLWRGEWSEAEAMLLSANGDLSATRPAEASEGIVRLAELRRRQGRLEEAKELLAQAETHPFRASGADIALLGRAEVAFEEGDTAAAIELAERYLRRLNESDRTERAAALELLCLVHTAGGDRELARQALIGLQTIAQQIATNPLRASVRFVEGIVRAWEAEHEAAVRMLEDSVDLYEQSGAPYETARAQIELARCLLAVGRLDAAGEQARKALEVFRALGADPDKARADALCEAITEAQTADRNNRAANRLTKRERQVLCLIASGKSNAEIAEQLVVSVRTVERHISSIYSKIGVSGTAARASATAYAIRHGMLP
jgi:ATP/maltotriose-dependent transcriptional regulator MalT